MGPVSKVRQIAAICLGLSILFGISACGPGAPDETPEGVTRELVARLGRLEGDPADAEAAYALLSSKAKANLEERARRYTDASGKQISPSAMIAPFRFLLRFEPQTFETRIVGAHAQVTVRGAQRSAEAEVACVLEEGAWRVDPMLPPLAAVITRPRIDP